MTIIYCDNKGCTFQVKAQCVRPHITLSNSPLLPPAPFLRLCRSYEERNLTSKCSGRDLSCVFEEAGELKCALTGKKVIVESRR